MSDRVPNQREVKVYKSLTDKAHPYTLNNLAALNEAASRLKSFAGFKLYMYFAKNQNKYNFDLSSTDFCNWAACSYKAYTTAFQELVKEGYLVKREESNIYYTFYDKRQAPESIEEGDTEEESKEFIF